MVSLIHAHMRLGNLVHGFGGGDGFDSKAAKRYLYEVTGISKGMLEFHCLEEKPATYHTYFEPIPLSEEWLVRFGFKTRPQPIYASKVEWVLDLDEDGKVNFISCPGRSGDLWISPICRGNYFGNNIQYVHQLQNLYFALTGKELPATITPTD